MITNEIEKEFEQLTKPLIEHIRNHHDLHTKIIVDYDGAVITQDLAGWNFDKMLSDMIKKD